MLPNDKTTGVFHGAEGEGNAAAMPQTDEDPAPNSAVRRQPIRDDSSPAPKPSMPPPTPSHFARLQPWIMTWVPLVTSIISFCIAMYTFTVTSRAPAVALILPDRIRVAQGAHYGYAYLYFQPTFVSAGASQRVEVITTMRLVVQPVGGVGSAGSAGPVDFLWKEQGRIDYDRTAARPTSYVYVADATPLLISPNTAQSPLSTFFGQQGWYFEPGTYQFTFTADRVITSQQISASFLVTFSKADVDLLNGSKGELFKALPLKKL